MNFLIIFVETLVLSAISSVNIEYQFLSNLGLMILVLWLVLPVAVFQELHHQQVGAC